MADSLNAAIERHQALESRSRMAHRRMGIIDMLGNAAHMREHDLTVYHDGSCPLCRLEIGHYRRQKGAERIAFVDVSDPCAHPGPGLSREDAMRRFHARLPNGELKSGAGAFVEIWNVLPRWRPLAKIARLSGATPVLDLGYVLFTPIRPVIAKIAGRLGLG